MTFREQCALAAMTTILEGGTNRPASGDEIARVLGERSWQIADAMEAERAKRVPTAAPDTIADKDGTRLTFTPTGDGKVRIHATGHATEVEKARREGRDAGLREVMNWLNGNGYDGAGMAIARFIANHLDPVEPAPDVASLQAENAKLRAVAEAAARYAKVEGDHPPCDSATFVAWTALARTLDAWRIDWRSRVTP